jgi:hypothetical protein
MPGIRGSATARSTAAVAALMLALTGVGSAIAATQVTQLNPGGLAEVGPVNTETGFPSWYKDKDGTRLELCLDGGNPLCGFLPGDIPDESLPISFPDNFPDEAFYMLAGSELELPGEGSAVLVLALEAAFSNSVTAGDQVVFGRQRVVVKGGPPNTTLTFQHPYGTLTIDTDGAGDGKLVEDISPAVGNFTTPLKSNIGPFLKWDPAVAPAAPEGYLGDPAQDHAVVGSPFNHNKFSVSGGGLALETDQFSLQGKIATNNGVNADYAMVNGDMLDVFASSEGSQLQVDGQEGKFSTTPMVTDDGSGRHYARIQFTGDAPASVKVTNIGDSPVSTSVVNVAKPSGVTVTKAVYDGSNLTVAATSTVGYPLEVTGLGTLESDAEKTFPVKAPPATVSVKAQSGGTGTLAVTVTGGAASPAGLDPIAPAPDPGPVIDTGSGADPNGTVTALAGPETAAVVRGGTVQLDASASTNASSYKWSQISGPAVQISGDTTSRPTVMVPYYATAPETTAAGGTVVLEVTATNAAGTSSATDRVELAVQTDSVTVAAGSRHRLGDELRINGTSTVGGTAAALNPATVVNIYDNTPGHVGKKLGTAQVDTLGAWSYRQRPGPSDHRITSVTVQSTRGGTATGTLATR